MKIKQNQNKIWNEKIYINKTERERMKEINSHWTGMNREEKNEKIPVKIKMQRMLCIYESITRSQSKYEWNWIRIQMPYTYMHTSTCIVYAYRIIDIRGKIFRSSYTFTIHTNWKWIHITQPYMHALYAACSIKHTTTTTKNENYKIPIKKKFFPNY